MRITPLTQSHMERLSRGEFSGMLCFMTGVVKALSAVSFVSNEIRQCQTDTVLTFLLVYGAEEQDGGDLSKVYGPACQTALFLMRGLVGACHSASAWHTESVHRQGRESWLFCSGQTFKIKIFIKYKSLILGLFICYVTLRHVTLRYMLLLLQPE